MKKEKGSVTVFMSLMLMILVIFEMAIITFAKAFAAMSITADACMTTQASLYACYNKPIRDAYGITVYTKDTNYLSHEGTDWFNESVDPLSLNPSVDKAGNLLRINGVVTVSYDSSDSLSIESNYVDGIVRYVKERDTLANDVTKEGVSSIKNNMEKAWQLRERFSQDVEDAKNGVAVYKDHGLMQDETVDSLVQGYSVEDVREKRNTMYKNADSDRLNLTLDFADTKYIDINPRNVGVSKLADDSWTDEQVVNRSIALIDGMNEYYGNLSVVESAIENKSEAYYVAQYTTEMFSAFNMFGEVSMSGNYFDSGDMISVNPYCETEYILFGNGDILTSSNTAKYMIFDNLYMGHLVNLMMVQPVDKRIVAYAVVLAEGDMSKVNMIVDALYSAEAAELAYQDMRKIYKFVQVPAVAWDGSSDWTSYQYYMELFGLIECCRNQSVVVARQKAVIEKNAANSCAEAKEFKFSKAYTEIYFDVDTIYAQ